MRTPTNIAHKLWTARKQPDSCKQLGTSSATSQEAGALQDLGIFQKLPWHFFRKLPQDLGHWVEYLEGHGS